MREPVVLEARQIHTRERLQATIEEYESAVEELKSSNEELQSMNEELQSTNEELETSKEELQSVNEELQTVNSELNVKVNEVESSGGTPGDWIELYNTADIPVSLAGYIVKDNDDTHVYILPSGSMITRGTPSDSMTARALPEVQQMSDSAFTSAEVLT